MNDQLIMLPVQVIEQEGAVILKRGLEQILIPDQNALVIIRVLQQALLRKPSTVNELLSLFAAPVRPLIEELLLHLQKKRFVVPLVEATVPHQPHQSESPQQIFYWHFNRHQQQIAAALNQGSWLLIGINKLTGLLLQAMLREGLQHYLIVDDPMLRNIELFDQQHQLTDPFWQQQADHIISESQLFSSDSSGHRFVVAASEFGSFFLLERWNEYAVRQQLPFYPAILQNMVGYAGPLVVPHESACLACLKSRQNSHSPGFAERRITEQYAFSGQQVVAYHQSMLQTLAAVAAFDLVKFSSNIQWEVGSLCEIDLLAGSMIRRKILKAPRCPICSGLQDNPLVNIYKQLTSDAAWQEIRQTVGDYEN